MREDGDLVPARLARGCRCFAVLAGRDLAGYGWLSTRPEWIGELQLEIRPGAGEGYIWNCVTLPEHRRKGVFRSVVAGIRDIARAEGLKRLWIGSVAIPAEKAVGTAGFKPALRFQTMDMVGLHFMRVGFPALEPMLATDAREVLGLRGRSHVWRTRRRRH